MKNNIIDLFMWGYQQHFQSSINMSAKDLFEKIDGELRAKVFLIGILVDERDDRHPLCLEPEDCGYDVNDFIGLKQLATELENVDPEGKIFHSHPIAQDSHNKEIRNKAYMKAIEKVLERNGGVYKYNNTERYISYPTKVDSFLVFVVLKLQKDALNKYYSLVNKKEKIFHRFPIYRSFIESVIYVYLDECSKALQDPNGAIDGIYRSLDELIREAGKKFMYTVGYAGNDLKYADFYDLYDVCNMIASLKYEKQEGLGGMVIARQNHPNIKFTLELEEPIRIREFRKVRKFLELSSEKVLLISDSAFIYGLGKIIGRYNPRDESLFIIKFISHFKWEVQHDNQSMMIVEYQQPCLPKELIDKNKFYSDLKRIFNDIKESQLNDLWDIVIEATKQKHGTMLVITDNAKEESKRLEKQCLSLKPLKLDTSIIQQITSIDGSVMIDRNALCYAVGVILDGNATDKGDSSRGARYNSAIRYYEQYGKDNSTVLVVISEDGMIDLIPNLIPQIKHSLIIEKIDKLEELSKQDEVDRKSFYQLMKLFQSWEFYLLQEECDKINILRQKIDEKARNPSEIWIIYQDLKPNCDMNLSYYLDE